MLNLFFFLEIHQNDLSNHLILSETNHLKPKETRANGTQTVFFGSPLTGFAEGTRCDFLRQWSAGNPRACEMEGEQVRLASGKTISIFIIFCVYIYTYKHTYYTHSYGMHVCNVTYITLT